MTKRDGSYWPMDAYRINCCSAKGPVRGDTALGSDALPRYLPHIQLMEW